MRVTFVGFQIKILLDRNIAQLLKASSIVEMEECVAQWSSETKKLLDNNSMEGTCTETAPVMKPAYSYQLFRTVRTHRG